MRMMQRVVMGAAAVVAVMVMAGPAAAVRPSCDDLVTLSRSGQSDERIAHDYGTTRALVAACIRLAEQNDRFASRREQFDQQRDARGLSH